MNGRADESNEGGDFSLLLFLGELCGEGEELSGVGERDEAGLEGGDGVRDRGGMSEWQESVSGISSELGTGASDSKIE